jgi:hypothetical protein
MSVVNSLLFLDIDWTRWHSAGGVQRNISCISLTTTLEHGAVEHCTASWYQTIGDRPGSPLLTHVAIDYSVDPELSHLSIKRNRTCVLAKERLS